VCLSCSTRFNTYEIPETALTFDEPKLAPEEGAEES
jgi:transcriptional regulator NrdR family protein